MRSAYQLCLASLLPAATVFAQGTAFTYQGALATSGVPVTGNYYIRFIAYDAAVGGSQIGNVVTNAASVTGGVFHAIIDFGSAVFDGSPRWIELGVGTNGAGGFTTLAPRQPVTPVPYAVRAEASRTALSANTAATVSAAGVLGQLSDATLSSNVALLNANQTFSGTVTFSNTIARGGFSGDGAGLTNISPPSRRLFYVQGNQMDGTDSGTVAGRTLNFTKLSPTSRLRITYTDNFRVTGGAASSATWEVKLDGASISPPCAFAVYTTTPSGGPNLHLPHTLVGYATNAPVGAHTLTITVGATTGFPTSDAFTGWNTTFLLEVEEIP